MENDEEMIKLMRILQFTDSAFPVGTFSFSNGLETASYERIVKDRASLESFARSQMRQAAFSDGVAAICTYRSVLANDYPSCIIADQYLYAFKMNDEARQMSVKMGKKFTELGVKLYDNRFLAKWLEDINSGLTPGMYPIAQGIIFALTGLSERQLFSSHQYGAINMILSAALRCVKVSHYDTQKIMVILSEEIDKLYQESSEMQLQDMNAFYPELDILASLHEKGKMRMFMN